MLAVAIVFVAAMPKALPAQDHSQDVNGGYGGNGNGINVIDQPQGNTNGGSSTRGPWGNSAGTSVGSTSAYSNDPTPGSTGTTGTGTAGGANAENNTDPRLGPRGGSIRSLGITREGRDPGGNPDVPFDDKMNLAFLAVGLVFAFLVFKKRTAVKTAIANK